MKLKNLYLLPLFALALWSCGDDEVKAPLFKYSQHLDMDNFYNLNTIKESPSAHSGKNICHVDSGASFGLIYSFHIPDSLIGKNIGVKVNAWIRTGDVKNNCDIICSVSNKDSLVMWQGFGAMEVLKTPNEWYNLDKTILIPHGYNKPETYVKIAPHNIDARSYFDIDDLDITYFEIEAGQ